MIDCGTSNIGTAGVCPANYACQAGGGGNFCTLNGFLPMGEERAPSVDGVIPARVESQNEWPQMRHAYCATGRDLRAETFTPSAYFMPASTARDTCTILPVY